MKAFFSRLTKAAKVLMVLLLLLGQFKSKAQWSILENYANYIAFPLNINSLAKDSKGNIYAGGTFKNDSGYNYIAKWDGKIWSELGGKNTSPFKNTISSILIDTSDNLYAAGEFVNANGKYYVAKWNGTNWSELGGTNSSTLNSFINSITIDASGNIYAGGWFTNNKGKQYVAKWNGTNWSELGGANTSTLNGAIKIVCADASGNVYITGAFTNTSNFMYITKWNGINWKELSGANNPSSRAEISAMTIDANGVLYAGGMFMNAKKSVYVAKWDGSWSELGGKDSTNFNISNTVKINTLAIDAYGNICVGVGSGSSQYIRLWKANKWNSLGGVFLYPTTSIISDNGGNIYTTGFFKNNVGNYFVNKWDGISWGELGVKNILTFFSQGINCVVTDLSGNVYAAPRSTNDSGKNYVTKWNGTSWSEVGGKNNSTFNGWVNSICFDTKGNLYAGGYFTNTKNKYYVAKWNGSSWIDLPWVVDSTWNRRILTLTPDSKGNVFAVTDYYVKKWNGTTWSTLDSGLFTYNGAFAIDANNNIYVVENNKTVSKYSTAGNGGFLELGGAGRSTFNGTINNLIIDAAGSLYATGSFTNSNGKRYVAKWNGSSWSEVGGSGNSTFNNQIFAIAIDKKTNIYVGGFFTNDSSKNYVARWNGTTWSELGGKNTSNFSKTIYTLTTDAIGNVFAGGIYSIKTASEFTSYVGKYTFNNTPYNISGNIATPILKAIPNVSIILNGNPSLTSTGSFALPAASSTPYTIRPIKNNDIKKANGVSTIDISIIQSHILKRSPLNSPYKIIAADANNDKKITSIDITYIKRLILGLDTTFTGNRLWAFIDSTYKFPDTTNPFPYKDSISFTNLTTNQTNQSFIGVKLGDVNYDWNPAILGQQAATNQSVELYYDTVYSNTSSEVKIHLKANRFKELIGMQFGLGFDKTLYDFVGIENNNLGIDYGATHTKEGQLTFLWNDTKNIGKTLADGSEIFTIVFNKKGNAITNSDLALNGDITAIEAYDKDLQFHNIVKGRGALLEKVIPISSVEKETMEVSPNPSNGNIVVTIQSKAEKKVLFNLMNVNGKMVMAKPLTITKGKNTIPLSLNVSTGTYYVTVEGIEEKVSKQVLILQ